MSKNSDKQPKIEETTLAGLLEAATGGDISATELVESLVETDLLELSPADMAMARFKKMAKKGPLPGTDDDDDADAAADPKKCARKEDSPAPQPTNEPEKDQSLVIPDSALAMPSFESLIDEKCGLRGKKKPKSKKKKMSDANESQKSDKKPILEFAAPERQDVIRWARGDEPKRIGEGKTPFWFKEDIMLSAGTPVAKRNLDEKKAQVVHPKNLSAYSGRHAVLANQGLRYAGYDVAVVDKL